MLFKKKLKSPWVSNLPLPIFTKLITEGYNILNDNELATKGNDMELFHFLSAGPLVINFAPQKLFENLSLIEDLIKNMKFIPFLHDQRRYKSYNRLYSKNAGDCSW